MLNDHQQLAAGNISVRPNIVALTWCGSLLGRSDPTRSKTAPGEALMLA